MDKFRVSRRKFMQSAASGLTFSVLGAPFGAQQAFAASLADEELRTVGLSVTVQERILADFKAKSGVRAVSGKGAIFPDTQTELLSGSTAYDCWETIGERLPAVIATNKIEFRPDLFPQELGQYPRHLHQAQSKVEGQGADCRPNLERPRANRAVDGPDRLQL